MKYKYIALNLKDYNKIRKNFSPYPNETVVSYFERVAKAIEKRGLRA